MAEVASAFVSLVPSARGFGSKLSNQVGGEVEGAGKGLGKRLGTAMKIGAATTLAGAVLAGGFIKGAIADASDLNEANSKVGVVFGKQANQIRAAAKKSAKAMGLSKSAYLDAAGTLGNLLVSLDIAPKKTAKMSKQMVKLAGDLASFNNTSPEDALDALKSGLTGETEPLKRYGVNMNDATLHTEALKLGLIKTIKDGLTPQTKALAAQSLIMAQTKTAQGDFARTSQGLANQQRIAAAEFADVKTSLGKIFLPVAVRVFRFLTSTGIPALGGIGDAFKRLGGPISEAAGFVLTAADDIKSFFTAGAGNNALKSSLKFVHDEASQIGTSFGKAADSLGRIKTTAQDVDFSKIDTKQLGKVLADSLFEGLKSLGKFTDKLLDFFKKVDWVGIGIKVGTFALPFVLGLATGIINGIGDPGLWKGIWEHLPDIIFAALAIVFAPSKLAGPITRILTKIPFVGRFLAVAFKWLNDLGGPLRSFGKDLFETFARAFKGELPFKGIVGRVLAGFRGLLARVGEFFSLLKTRLGVWALDAFGAMGRFAGKAINRLIRLVTFIPSKILGALGDMGSLLFNAGKELIGGLIRGITSKLADLGKAMKGVADKIKGYLPGSPVKTGPLTSWNNGGAGKRLVGLLADGLADTRRVDTAMSQLSSRIATSSVSFDRSQVASTVGTGPQRMRLVIPGHEFDGYVDYRADSRVGAQRGIDGMTVRAFG